jgi:DNA-binding Lrp family transcriptional regulator
VQEEKIILRKLQKSFPLISRPFKELAEQTGLAEDDLLNVIRELKQKGIIRRIAGVVRHLQAGFLYNGLVCFAINPALIMQAGAQLAAAPLVSHCYWRKSFPEWPYSLYAMVHTRKKSICEQWAAREAARLACPDYLLLFSSKEYKKERVKLNI